MDKKDSGNAADGGAPTELTPVTLALGLRSTAQSLGVIGRALGAFEAQGLDLQIVREETAGPAGAAGLMSGEFQFAEFGSVPVVQAALEGHDPLIIMAAEQVAALYLLGRKGLAGPAQIKTVGVLSAAGQTGFSARQMLARWDNHEATLLPLGTYPAIYRALAEGQVDAGVLTADYKLAGELAYGFCELADLGQSLGYQGPVLATTRRLAQAQPALLGRMLKAYLQSIWLFKHSAAAVIPVLQRHLGFVDADQAAAIQAFYAARFQDRPVASPAGIRRVIDSFAGQYPAAKEMLPAAVYDEIYLEAALRERA
ncbi:ABC transporter substrate-binding protein [Lacisediminimonas sp.]|uniref:ABC transporter substrate-binding protein n=1 Tax=Lacisediminimonas sp. TaxID=3060582 RepID=UPI002728757D|nr:ABC transporter substrate-binding protein [Lacisediminimonas sp.]MDO8301062.1 ABC transporter substrate-binding protein [Lacisediminimonas sp.]